MQSFRFTITMLVLLVVCLLAGCRSSDGNAAAGIADAGATQEAAGTDAFAGEDPAPVIPGEHVFFRGNQASHNSRYYARIVEGDIQVKPNVQRTGLDGPWVVLTGLPSGLLGEVTELAMDDEHIIALNSQRQIYTMWKANRAIEEFHWQKAWGFPFWYGPGMQLREDLVTWDFSVVSLEEDGCWTDPAGNLHAVGAGKCSHIIMLNPGGNTLTFNDPWLPRDYSYEIGMPYRGRFQAVRVSSSGSTHFIINRYGDMYTRLFDFDISGLDALFMPSTYEDQHGAADPLIQLPAEDWRLQPKIDTAHGRASITDRISITKTGRNCVHRLLRVEGTNAYGSTGYYEKDLRETSSAAWVFHRTDLPLQGEPLENTPEDRSGLTLTANTEDRLYVRHPDGLWPDCPHTWPWVLDCQWHATLNDFNCYHSPATLTVFCGSAAFDLRLHYRGTIRILPRPRGLDDNPRVFSAAIEIPPALIENPPDEDTAAFLRDYLDTARWTEVTLLATLDEVRLCGLAANGRPLLWTFNDGRWAEERP